MNEAKNSDILFIAGRPDAHIIHKKYALALDAECTHEDAILRWHDRPGTSKFIILLSLLLNGLAFTFSHKKILFTESVRFPALMAHFLSFKRKKIVALMADQSLSFYLTGRFSPFVRFFYRTYWKSCTAIVCIGDLQRELMEQVIKPADNIKLFTIYNGLDKEEREILSAMQIQPDGETIIAITHLGAEFRLFYKGIDLMVKGFVLALKQRPTLRLKIYGVYAQQDLQDLKRITDLTEFPPQISFEGNIKPVYPAFAKAALHLQIGRWDAFPTSTLEALYAGVPTIVSQITGTRTLIREIDEQLVIQDGAESVQAAILRFFELPENTKKEYSEKGKKVVAAYTEENAIQQVRLIFASLISH